MTTYTTGLTCPVCLQLTSTKDFEPCDECAARLFEQYMTERGEW